MTKPLFDINWQKVRKDLLLVFSSHFFYKIIGFLVLMILTRYLEKDEMGEFFFAASLASLFVLITELGVNTHLTREVATKPESAIDYFSEVISLRLPLFVSYFFILNCFTFIFKPDIFVIVLLTSIYVLLDEFYYSLGALFLGLKRVANNAIAGISSRVLLVGSLLIIISLKGGLTAIITCYILASIFLVGIAFVLLHKNRIGRLRLIWSWNSARKVLRISFPFFLLAVLGIIHFKVDTLMLGFMRSYSEVATYEAAYRLLEASRFVTRPIAMIFFPICSEMAARENWLQIQTLLRKLLMIIGALGAAITTVIVITAGFVITLAFGSEYTESISVLRVLFLSVPMLYIASVSSLLAKSMRLEVKIVKIMIVCVVINIVLNSIGIPLWGPIGAAWTTMISETILAVWLVKLNFQELRVLCSRERMGTLKEGLGHVE